jgi:hypothetical protein
MPQELEAPQKPKAMEVPGTVIDIDEGPLGVGQLHTQLCEASSLSCSPSRLPVKSTGVCNHH